MDVKPITGCGVRRWLEGELCFCRTDSKGDVFIQLAVFRELIAK